MRKENFLGGKSEMKEGTSCRGNLSCFRYGSWATPATAGTFLYQDSENNTHYTCVGCQREDLRATLLGTERRNHKSKEHTYLLAFFVSFEAMFTISDFV